MDFFHKIFFLSEMCGWGLGKGGFFYKIWKIQKTVIPSLVLA